MFLRENIDDCVVCNNILIALLMTPKNLCTNTVVHWCTSFSELNPARVPNPSRVLSREHPEKLLHQSSRAL